jgi:putative cell wall-binding protein
MARVGVVLSVVVAVVMAGLVAVPARATHLPAASQVGRLLYDRDGAVFSAYPGGVETFIADGVGPRVDATGRRALVHRGGDVHTVDIGGGQVTNLTATATVVEFDAAWSPDGSTIAYIRDAELWAMSANGSNSRFLARPAGGPVVWSGDGRTLAFKAGEFGQDVGLLDVANGVSRQVWAPQGRLLIAVGADLFAFTSTHDPVNQPAETLSVVRSSGEVVVAHLLDYAPPLLDLRSTVDGGAVVAMDVGRAVYRVTGLPARPTFTKIHQPVGGPEMFRVEPQPTGTVRLAGADRVETAIAVSHHLYGDGQAGAVVLARADAFPDALAGGPYAAVRNGPLLLTGTDQLDDRVNAEIRRVLPAGGDVVVLGGPAAISDAVVQQLQTLGYQPRRLAGTNRFATSVAVADAMPAAAQAVVVAHGGAFHDALVGSVAAGRLGGPLLLTDGDRLPAETDQYLAANGQLPVTAVGSFAAAAVPSAAALSGVDAAGTAAAVADALFADAATMTVATDASFADALAGVPLAIHTGSPLLYAEGGGVPAATVQVLTDRPSRVFLLGGPAALGDVVADTVHALAPPTAGPASPPIAADCPDPTDITVTADASTFGTQDYRIQVDMVNVSGEDATLSAFHIEVRRADGSVVEIVTLQPAVAVPDGQPRAFEVFEDMEELDEPTDAVVLDYDLRWDAASLQSCPTR